MNTPRRIARAENSFMFVSAETNGTKVFMSLIIFVFDVEVISDKNQKSKLKMKWKIGGHWKNDRSRMNNRTQICTELPLAVRLNGWRRMKRIIIKAF